MVFRSSPLLGGVSAAEEPEQQLFGRHSMMIANIIESESNNWKILSRDDKGNLSQWDSAETRIILKQKVDRYGIHGNLGKNEDADHTGGR